MSQTTLNTTLEFTRAGEDLRLTEKEIPPIPPGEVLVKVHAASINPVDVQLWRSQLTGIVAGDKSLGRDFSGTVVQVGKDVQGWEEGDDIFGLVFEAFGQGTFSTYLHLNPSTAPVVKKPNCLSHEAAASLPLVTLTAFACLDWLPPATSSKRKVIIRGASGGTGSWLVQLAKISYECHVTAICSAKNADYVKRLGADDVIDYSTQPIIQTLLEMRKASPDPYDLLVDCVGGTDPIKTYPQLLHKSGAYVTIVGDKTNINSLGGPITYLTHPAQVIRYIKGWIWGPRYACVSLYQKAVYLEKVVALAERGELHVEIQEVIKGAMDERQGWKKAVELIEGGRIRGKVILQIA